MYRGDFPGLSEFLRSPHDEQHVDCRARWAKATLLLGDSRESIPPASQYFLRRDAPIFSNSLPEWATSEIPQWLLQSERSFFL